MCSSLAESVFFEKNQKNFINPLDKEEGKVYNNRADFGRGSGSLKIEQHEISSTEKCERFSLKHFEKRNSKK